MFEDLKFKYLMNKYSEEISILDSLVVPRRDKRKLLGIRKSPIWEVKLKSGEVFIFKESEYRVMFNNEDLVAIKRPCKSSVTIPLNNIDVYLTYFEEVLSTENIRRKVLLKNGQSLVESVRVV